MKPPSVLVKPTAVKDVATDRALSDLRAAIAARRGLLDKGVLLEDVVLSTTVFKRVKHGLKRRPAGYFVARIKSAPAAAFSIYDNNEAKSDTAEFLYLRTVGASVTVDLVVF